MKEFYKVPNEELRKQALGSLPGLPFTLRKALTALLPMSIPMTQPLPGQWLYEHEEEGQSYDAYTGQMHNIVDQKRNTIYITALQEIEGEFLGELKDYCQRFFRMNVKLVNNTKTLHNVPSRINEYSQKKQYNAKEILTKLQKTLPADAFCMIGICLTDLYPRDEWNFVFGLASIKNRTGVFSFARYSQSFYTPGQHPIDYSHILWRSIGVMTHEITHMFGVRHCIYYMCLMNGSNHLQEGDKKPLELCIVCLRKLQSNIKFDILQRYEGLMAFVEKREKDKKAEKLTEFLSQSIKRIKQAMKM